MALLMAKSHQGVKMQIPGAKDKTEENIIIIFTVRFLTDCNT
jgi:hypothetical protein